MPLPANSRLGPYEIRSMLGAGGMGEVYHARDTRLNRDVAVKVLREDDAASADNRSRFEREGRALAALSLPISWLCMTSAYTQASNILSVNWWRENRCVHSLRELRMTPRERTLAPVFASALRLTARALSIPPPNIGMISGCCKATDGPAGWTSSAIS